MTIGHFFDLVLTGFAFIAAAFHSFRFLYYSDSIRSDDNEDRAITSFMFAALFLLILIASRVIR